MPPLNKLAAHEDSFERISCAQPRQWLYLFGNEGGIVYSEIHNRFAGLDAAGVATYLAFDAGLPFQPPQQADHVQHQVIESIHALAGGIFPATEPQQPWPEFDPHAGSNQRGETLLLANIPVSIQFPAGPFENLSRAPFRGCKPTSDPPRCHLSAARTDTGWAIFVNGQLWMPLEREEQLGLGLLHAARAMLYQLGSYDIAFHAAMVARQNLGILLCAPRESGKSTLAAYLAAAGFHFLADEPALLQIDALSIHPLPLPISLKAGSWTPLAQACPHLAAELIHTRSDGTPIRLVLPPEEYISAHPQRLTHIVFPEYSASATAQLEPLSPLRTLTLLHAGGMLFAQGSTRKTFEAFLRAICRTPAFRLLFSSLEEAARLLRSLR